LKPGRCLLSCLAALLGAAPLAAQQLTYTPVSQQVLEERLKRGSTNNREREAALRKLFEEAGCLGVAEQASKGLSLPNVLCTLAGEEKDTIVVGGHYDKVPQGEGIIDNWSGAALLPSLFESLHQTRRRLTFVFVGFSGEEVGLRGSRTFVNLMNAEDRANVKAMINIDCLGLGPTKLEVRQSDPKLVEAVARVAHAMTLPVGVVNLGGMGLSDATSFREIRVPTLDFHSLTRDTLRFVNSSRDRARMLRLSDYADSYRLIGGVLAFVDVNWGVSELRP
jgi:acetylornithine deacetylase/succinyl-diaminopimelate desuccinylase-like protein